MPLDPAAIQAHLDGLTKPPGSLGRLERLAARLCAIQRTLAPVARPRRLVVFAADHGVTAEGVSAWPSAVTGLMVANIRAGGAASNVLARASGTELRLVDCGAAGPPVEPAPHVRVARVANGTRNLARGPAMDVGQFDAAWALGAEEAESALGDGVRVLLAGEMGIGNTTSASALAMLLADVPLDRAVGRGAGSDDAQLARKVTVVAEAVERARARARTSPRAAVADVCGFEIAAMAGFFAAGAAGGATLLVDGLIATAGALAAEAFAPGCVRAMIAAHRSLEPAHGAMLEQLGLEPFLEWELRLGEGTGALLLCGLLDAAAAMCGEMATLKSMGIG
jgi:nicotinate-nucleotide--dimethylbenzimidazole phosphoribosyltransferase